MNKLPKQETIEEVAERMYPINNTGIMFMANREELNNSLKQEGFIEGYNHAVKTHYTEEDLKDAFFNGIMYERGEVKSEATYNKFTGRQSKNEVHNYQKLFNPNKKK